MISICNQENLFRLIAMFPWFLNYFLIVVFATMIRIYDRERAAEQDQEEDATQDSSEVGEDRPPRSNYPKRPRRLALRPHAARRGATLSTVRSPFQ
ncbi:hypothetical protein CAEBREN_18270 [Caenorhabditis brenneri]|uniref:Uncharacterized protein n=1 Tax=Caenorhabditis brenneri TaxID=135651 RepID=G0M829_CAEBE|nr:hypothetical protein CAEBREN_18270 [Caenorhabditis brenneri]